jgi:hypothetical protein
MTFDRCRPHLRRALVALTGGLTVATLTACGSSRPAATAKPKASSTTSTTTGASDAGTNLHGKRYCEVLLVTLTGSTGTGDVFNSFPMNACPQARWAALDAGTVARDAGVPIAVLNGPRYWLMDSIKNYGPPDTVSRTFGGIEMTKRATVDIGPIAQARVPYTTHAVNRSVVFRFERGTTIYELKDPAGHAYVMQTWSQQVDPALAEADLAGIGPRLHPPAGWTYSSRTLTTPLVVDTRSAPAHVLQDDLGNSYSLTPGA